MQIKKLFVCPHGDSILYPEKIKEYEYENK